MKGAKAKDARFEAPEAPMGWSVGRGVPSPLKKGSGKGAVPPPQKFFWFNVFQKFLCSGQGGGHRPVALPLNTPLVVAVDFITLSRASNFLE